MSNNNYPGLDQSDAEMRAAADAAIKATETQQDRATRQSWGVPDTPELNQPSITDWKKGSRKESTRGPNIAGTASLDSVHVDATKSPYDFTDALRQAASNEQTQAARVLAGEDPTVVEQTPTQPLTQSNADVLWEKLSPVIDKLELELAANPTPARRREIQAAQRTIDDLRKLPVPDQSNLTDRLARLNGLVTGLDASKQAERRAIDDLTAKLYGERSTGEESSQQAEALLKKCAEDAKAQRQGQP
jgi:hypothetical protein